MYSELHNKLESWCSQGRLFERETSKGNSMDPSPVLSLSPATTGSPTLVAEAQPGHRSKETTPVAFSPTRKTTADQGPDSRLLVANKDLVRCAICSNTYSHPRILSCLHTFCYDCLRRKMVDLHITCPRCAVVTALDNRGVDGLLTDMSVLTVLADDASGRARKEASCVLCTERGAMHTCVAECYQCKGSLCVACTQVHRQMHAYADHRVVLLTDVKEPAPIMCETHAHERCTLFCRTCQLPLCAYCSLSLPCGTEHQVEDLFSCINRESSNMQRIACEARAKISDLNHSGRKIDRHVDGINLQYRKSGHDLDQTYRIFISSVEDCYKDYREQLFTGHHRAIEFYQNLAIKMKEQQKVLHEGAAFIDRFMKYTDKAQHINYKSLVDNNVTNLLNISPNIPYRDPELTFNVNFNMIQSGVQNSFGYPTVPQIPEEWFVHDAPRRPVEPYNLSASLLSESLIQSFRSLSTAFMPGPLGATFTPPMPDDDDIAQPQHQQHAMNYAGYFDPAPPVRVDSRSAGLYNSQNYPSNNTVNSMFSTGSGGNPQYERWSNGANRDAFKASGGAVASGGATAAVHDIFSTAADPVIDYTSKQITSNVYPPKSHIKRQKMIYHSKFGEFGVGETQFTEPSGVAVNAQNDIIVADTNNHRIQIFDKDGRFKFQFGEVGKRDNQLLYPNRVAVVKKSGDIVVTERSPTHQVQIYNQYGHFIRKFGASVLQHPRGVAIDNQDHIIIIECKVMRVIIFDMMGNVINKFSCSKYLEFPNGVVVNDREEIFISDNRAHCVKVFSYQGMFLRQIGKEGITNYPIGVGISPLGEVLIADNHNNFNITVFTQEGELLNALESKVKHAQCFDVALMDDGSIVLASKDYRLYIYRYSQHMIGY